MLQNGRLLRCERVIVPASPQSPKAAKRPETLAAVMPATPVKAIAADAELQELQLASPAAAPSPGSRTPMSLGLSTPAPGGAPGTPNPHAAQFGGASKLAQQDGDAISLLKKSQPASGPTCCKCGLRGNATTANDKYDIKIGVSAKTTQHVACHRSYGALTRRWAKDPAVKVWWESKGEDDKAQWYLGRLATERKMGEDHSLCIDVVSSQSSATGNETRGRDAYITFRDWCIEEKILNPGISMVELQAQWNQLITSGSTPKLWDRGQWLLGQYKGVVSDDIDSNMTTVTTTRSSKCRDATSLRAARSDGQNLIRDAKRMRRDQAPTMPVDLAANAVPRHMAANDVTDLLALSAQTSCAWEGELWQLDEDTKRAAEVVLVIPPSDVRLGFSLKSRRLG